MSTDSNANLPRPDFSEMESMKDSELRKATVNLILECQEAGVSDLHLSAGNRPRVRHHREIIYLGDDPLSESLAERMNLLLLPDKEHREKFATHWDMDYPLTLAGSEQEEHVRFRVNLVQQKKGVSGVYHIIPRNVRSLEDLGFPNADRIRTLLTYHNGILLVTGPVGSGKTTTLASLIKELNDSRNDHIIAIEDPIEIVQESHGCIVSQREVKTHTQSFGRALKSALREDPDVIVIGEMRNLETIEMAVTAAETGHLVIATMHTRDASTTLNRLLDVFPARQQNQIRAMVADSLRGILCQRLLPGREGDVVLAAELLVNNPAVANIIREGKETGIESTMQTGKNIGMRTMDESIRALLEQERITEETAEAHL